MNVPSDEESRQPSFLDTPSPTPATQQQAPQFPQFQQRPPQQPQPGAPSQRPISQMQIPLEHMIAEPETGNSLLRTAMMLGVMVLLAVLGWFAYQEAKAPNPDDPVPVLKADSAPFKQAPVDPGGEQIPNKDREVFNALASKKSAEEEDKEAISTRPQPEQPINREALDAIAAMEGEDGAPAKNPLEQPVVKKAAPKPEPKTEVKKEAKTSADTVEKTVKKEEEKPAPKTENKAVENKVQEKTEEKTANAPSTPPASTQQLRADEMAVAPAEQPTSNKTQQVANAQEVIRESEKASVKQQKAASAKLDTSSAGGRLVQISAVKNEAEAAREWGRLQKRFPQELGALKYRTQRVDLPGKGTFYRVQAGPVASHEAAKSLCTKLTAKKQGCIIVR